MSTYQVFIILCDYKMIHKRCYSFQRLTNKQNMFPLMKLRKKLHDGSVSSKASKHKITAECIIKEKNPPF